jgi:hypothetical protein
MSDDHVPEAQIGRHARSSHRARQPALRSTGSSAHIGLFLTILSMIVAVSVAVITSVNNHNFERRQAALARKFAAYPKLQADVLALQEAVSACYASEEMVVPPETQLRAGITNQREWFEQHIVEPVMAASEQLTKDSSVLVDQMSFRVRDIMQETQKSQPLSRNLCIHYTSVLMRHVDEHDFGAPAVDQVEAKTAVMKMVDFLKTQGEKLNAQITAEIGSH